MEQPGRSTLFSPEIPAAPETFLSLMSHAEELIDGGHLREARRLLAQFVERKNLDPRLLPSLAALYLRVGKPDQAIRTMHRAIEQGGANPELHNTLGLIFALLGRESDSRIQFEKALSLDPSNPEALRNLAFIFHRTGNRGDAYALLIRCFQATPLSVELRLICGTLLEMDRRLSEAATCYREVIDLSTVCEQVQLASQRLVALGSPTEDLDFEQVIDRLRSDRNTL